MKKNISTIIILLIGLSILSFVVVKSNTASFTHDESFTYTRYVHQSYFNLIFHTDPFTNNHLLNTILMKTSEKLLGSSEIALRLPNILMLIVFFIYSFLLFKKNDRIISIVVFGLIFTNITLLDFFSLARGYGLSISFMVMSIYHLITSFSQNKNKNLILFHLTALLAILSNFTLLDYYVAALFVYALIYFIEYYFIDKRSFSFFKSNTINIILFLIVFIILYEPVRKVIKYNSFDFGGKDGFLQDTLQSFISYCLYNININNIKMIILEIIFLIPVFISVSIFIINTFKRNKEFWINNKPFYFINLLLITVSFGTITQHILFKTDYIVGRFSLFLFPLYILNLGYLMEYLIKINKFRNIILGFAIVLVISSSVRFCFNADKYSYAEWNYDCETKNMLKDFIKLHEYNLKQNNIKLGINWLFEPTINFYRQTMHITWLLPVDRDGMKPTDDYFYSFKGPIPNINPETYTKIKEYNKSGTALYKN